MGKARGEDSRRLRDRPTMDNQVPHKEHDRGRNCDEKQTRIQRGGYMRFVAGRRSQKTKRENRSGRLVGPPGGTIRQGSGVWS